MYLVDRGLRQVTCRHVPDICLDGAGDRAGSGVTRRKTCGWTSNQIRQT